jgi:hypothetical protein
VKCSIIVAVLGCLLLGSGIAHGQPAGEQAIALGKEGLARYEQGEWGVAFELFARAEEHHHSPVFLLHMARCRRSEGAFLEARRIFERIVDETFDADAPIVFDNAKRDATAELKALSARIPKVIVVSENATLAGVGGTEGSPLQVFEVDPGRHLVWAMRGSTRREREIEMSPGQEMRVTLEVPLPPTRVPDPTRIALEPDVLAGWRMPVVVSGGVFATLGVGALVAGVVTGSLAQRDEARAEELCPNLVCAQEGYAVVQRGRDYALASEVTFATGGVMAVAGVVMMIVPFLLGPAAPDAANNSRGLLWRF